jgi:two-component system NarL family sensor kinase
MSEIIEVGMPATETAEDRFEDLLGELLGAQDEEWRRIAGELHDTTAQHLAAVLMGIDHVLASRQDRDLPLMRQTRLLVDQSLREIRALCYRLHPPMLEELGLAPALTWLVRGVRQEIGFDLSLDLPRDLGRLPREIETGLFRLVQAELANLQEQEGISEVRLALSRPASAAVLTIEVRGRAVHNAFDARPSRRADAGIDGMRARIHKMGGGLRIASQPWVTHLVIELPVQAGEDEAAR